MTRARDLSNLIGSGNVAGDTMTSNLSFSDNDKAIFGASNDLQIYHDGSNNRIVDSGTGSLYIQGQQAIILANADASEFYATFDVNGAATLRYDNAQKLATTSTGADITGTLTSDGLTVDGDATISSNAPTLLLNDTDNNIEHKIIGSGNGDLEISADSNNVGGLSSQILFKIDGTLRAKIGQGNEGGDISFYEATGNTAKFYWDASAERLGIGTSSPLNPLHVGTSAANTVVSYFNNTDTASGNGIMVRGGGSNSLKYVATFQDAAANTRMHILANGNVGIGTSSPTGRLDITGSSGEQLRVINTGAGASSALFQNSTSGTGSGNGLFLGVSAGVNYLWTYEDQPIVLATDNLERMRIDSSGNVGIGVTDPDSGLEVQSSASGTNSVHLSNTSSTGYGAKFVGGGNTSTRYIADFRDYSGTSKVKIDGDGNVGIGTSSPSAPLHIDGAGLGDVYSGLIENTTTDTDHYNVVRWRQGASGSATGMVGTGGSSASNTAFRNNFVVGTQTNHDLVFTSNDTERMRIDAAGRVTMPYQPAFHATRTSHVTSSGNIVFQSVNRNIGGCYNNTNGRFTAPVAGTYSFSFSTLLYTMGYNSLAQMHVNGTASYYGMSSLGTYGAFTGSYAGQGATVVVGLSAGDYVNVYFSHSGTGLHSHYTYWSGHLVG